MTETLSTQQWQRLQTLFDQAESLDEDAVAALLSQTRSEDPHVAESLAAMLDAHHRWRTRTADAQQNLAVASRVSAVGARLGAYQLVSEIGRGGMGVVYLADRVDGQVQQQVAIKVLHTHNLDSNTRARFQREREILADFDHPGIARLLDAGESRAGEPYFVMEYLRGLTITAHCDQHHLTIRARLQLFLQVCDAVQYAHGKLILHRDIKANNVVVDGAGVPRLIDFGIAKPLCEAGMGQLDDTVHAQRFFSPVNASPEQIRGDSVAVTCDVYQLGTLLYELLCGQALFDLRGKTPAQIEEQICELPPRAPSDSARDGDSAIAAARRTPNNAALARALQGDLDAITLRAVRKHANRRYASVEQLADDVRRYLANLPVLGRRGGTWYRATRFAQRNWRGLAVSGLAIVGVIVFAGLLIQQQRLVVVERDSAVAERKRAEGVADFLVEMFRSADTAPNGGIDTPIKVILKRAEEMLDRRIETDVRTRARLLATLTIISVNLSDLAAAEAQILKAVKLLESSTDGQADLLAEYYQRASGVLLMNGKNEQSSAMAESALRMYTNLGEDVSKSWYAQLNILRVRMDVDNAAACEGLERLLRESRAASGISPNAYGVILKFVSRCRPNTVTGLARNEAELRDAIASISDKLEASDPLPFQLKQYLASVLMAQNRLEESESVLTGMLPQQEAIYGRDSWSVAYTLLRLGRIAYEKREFVKAEALLSRALQIFLVVHQGQPGEDTAAAEHALGLVSEFGKHDLPKAREYYARALEAGQSAMGPESQNLASIKASNGSLLFRAGDMHQAEPLLTDAIALLPHSDRRGARARIALASIHIARGEAPEAKVLLSDAEEGMPAAIDEDPTLPAEIQRVRTHLERTAPAR